MSIFQKKILIISIIFLITIEISSYFHYLSNLTLPSNQWSVLNNLESKPNLDSKTKLDIETTPHTIENKNELSPVVNKPIINSTQFNKIFDYITNVNSQLPDFVTDNFLINIIEEFKNNFYFCKNKGWNNNKYKIYIKKKFAEKIAEYEKYTITRTTINAIQFNKIVDYITNVDFQLPDFVADNFLINILEELKESFIIPISKEFQETITKYEEKINKLNSKISDFENKINSQQSKIKTLEPKNHPTLKAQKDSLKMQIIPIKNQIKSEQDPNIKEKLKIELNQLQERKIKVGHEIIDIEHNVDIVNNEIKILKDNLKNLNSFKDVLEEALDETIINQKNIIKDYQTKIIIPKLNKLYQIKD
ncbi:hypothetical protein [Candidatus Phytoplasma prunorum]|uniref:hypothetical protein n=1 Tax=Candidatus Phytoplasma prunorum TaxID=47565 RepID=UPI002FF2932E